MILYFYLFLFFLKKQRKAERERTALQTHSSCTGVDSPAGHGDLHFGGGDAATDGVEITDGRRGLYFLYNVSFHVGRRCGANTPTRVSASEPARPKEERRSAAHRRAGTVQANLLSAVHWTDNSMESLWPAGCSAEQTDLTNVSSTAGAHQLPHLPAPSQAKNELLCQRSAWKVKAGNSTPPACILLHPWLRLTLVTHPSYWSTADRYFGPNWFGECNYWSNVFGLHLEVTHIVYFLR